MGKIEWAMWANEQALASGLSEYKKFSKTKKKKKLEFDCLINFHSNRYFSEEIVFFFIRLHQFVDRVNATY